MQEQLSVSRWIAELKQGDGEAAGRLWESYFERLVHLAHAHLHGVKRGAADEEDVALSAFDSLCRGVATGRFPKLDDRDDLWQLLVRITVCKAVDLRQFEARQKRGGGRTHSLSDLPDECRALLSGDEPSPELAAQLAEEYTLMMNQLGNPMLRDLAQWKLEGYTNHEIASRLGCAVATVERKLRLIRRIWESAGPNASEVMG